MIESATFSKAVRRMLGLPLHSWENVMIGSLVVAGLSALIAGLSTWAVVRLQRVEIARSAAELERYIAEAGARISANEVETARANEETERLRNANLKLEEKLAPRSLTDEQISRIRDKMVLFSGQKFKALTYWDVAEPDTITKRIGNDALIAAGWQFIKDETFTALIGVVTGIEVQTSMDSNEEMKKAASALVDALVAEHLSAQMRFEPTLKDLILLQVGVKPQD